MLSCGVYPVWTPPVYVTSLPGIKGIYVEIIGSNNIQWDPKSGLIYDTYVYLCQRATKKLCEVTTYVFVTRLQSIQISILLRDHLSKLS